MIQRIYRGMPKKCTNISEIINMMEHPTKSKIIIIGENSKEMNQRILLKTRNFVFIKDPVFAVDKFDNYIYDMMVFNRNIKKHKAQHYFDYWSKLKDWGVFVIYKNFSEALKFCKQMDCKPHIAGDLLYFIKIPNPNKRIILIGNGASIKNNEMGSEIDSYDEIYRFNCFKIEGFEKYTGVKTDVWVLNQSKNDVMPLLKKIRNKTTIEPIFSRYLLAPYYSIKKYGDREVSIEKMAQYVHIHDQGHIIEKVSQETYWNTSRACQLEEPVRKRKQATTGTITIQHLIEQGYRNITLCGFDIAFSGERSLPHYFEKNNPKTHHVVGKEHEYIKKLMDIGLVKTI